MDSPYSYSVFSFKAPWSYNSYERFGEPSYPDPSPLTICKNRLMVKGLPPSANVMEVEATFARFGPIVRIRILHHEATEQPKGSAIVQYPYESEDVEKATVSSLQYGDYPLEVSFLNPSTDLKTSSTFRVNHIPGFKEQDLRRLFALHGPIVGVYIPKGKSRELYRSYVTFKDKDDAEIAFANMNGKKCGSVVLELEWANFADF